MKKNRVAAVTPRVTNKMAATLVQTIIDAGDFVSTNQLKVAHAKTAQTALPFAKL